MLTTTLGQSRFRSHMQNWFSQFTFVCLWGWFTAEIRTNRCLTSHTLIQISSQSLLSLCVAWQVVVPVSHTHTRSHLPGGPHTHTHTGPVNVLDLKRVVTLFIITPLIILPDTDVEWRLGNDIPSAPYCAGEGKYLWSLMSLLLINAPAVLHFTFLPHLHDSRFPRVAILRAFPLRYQLICSAFKKGSRMSFSKGCS